jgi:hypothetical protein
MLDHSLDSRAKTNAPLFYGEPEDIPDSRGDLAVDAGDLLFLLIESVSIFDKSVSR